VRTFEEIQADVDHADRRNDAVALEHYAAELDGLQTPMAVATATNARGSAFGLRGNNPASLEYYQRARGLFAEIGNRVGVATTTGSIGICYAENGDYPMALEHFHRALALYEELGNDSGMARFTTNIGNVHSLTGDYPTALEHFHRALQSYEQLGDLFGVAAVMGSIGSVYRETVDYPAALEHNHRALAMYKELGDRSSEATVSGNIGNILADAGDFTAALDYMHRAQVLYEELGERNGLARVMSTILSTQIAMGSDDEARSLLLTMDDMQIDVPTTWIWREQSRATLQERSGDLDEAASTLLSALRNAQDRGLRYMSAAIHKRLRDLAQKRSDFAGYIEHNNEFTRITGEINGKDTATKLAMQAKQREIDAVQREHQKHLAVLHSTLPQHVADRVARGEIVNDQFDNAAVLFLDVVGFTTNSGQLNANVVVDLLQNIFTTFDGICDRHDVMKIKTIGDSYMAVAFGTTDSVDPERRAAAVAMTMMECPFAWPHSNEPVVFRIGLHSGPVVAGVLGTSRLQYDVWGDTVNVASRMESSGEPGRIHVSEAFATALHLNDSLTTDTLTFLQRGEISVKGKGPMTTYWLEAR
jgi:class 3 adenylate cyclase/Flp pilus assembly protein TadD